MAVSSAAVASRPPYQIPEKTSLAAARGAAVGGWTAGLGGELGHRPPRTAVDHPPLHQVADDGSQAFPDRLPVTTLGGQLVGVERQHTGGEIGQLVGGRPGTALDSASS